MEDKIEKEMEEYAAEKRKKAAREYYAKNRDRIKQQSLEYWIRQARASTKEKLTPYQAKKLGLEMRNKKALDYYYKNKSKWKKYKANQLGRGGE